MKLKTNHVKQRLKEGGVVFGTMLRILKSPDAISLCASEDWDYVILDTEHNDYDHETLSNFSLIAKYEKLALLVRVPDKLYHQMARVLDLGVEGLVLPQVKKAEEAEHIIRSTKYGPIGQRGVSKPTNVTLFRNYGNLDYYEWANRENLTVIQIESMEGVRNIDDIVSVDGIDAIMIGPADLTMDMGIPGQFNHPKVSEAYHIIMESCNNHGVAPGIHLQNLEDVRKWINAGMRFVTYSYDANFFKEALHESLIKLRSMVNGRG